MHSSHDTDIDVKDERIHMCLYFIAAHRMKEIDENFINQVLDNSCPKHTSVSPLTLLTMVACLPGTNRPCCCESRPNDNLGEETFPNRCQAAPMALAKESACTRLHGECNIFLRPGLD